MGTAESGKRRREPTSQPDVEHLLDFVIQRQPTETTCGPTCLHSVYRYYRDEVPLERVIEEVLSLEEGGTLGVALACHALRRGYRATIHTYNLQTFDPTWFDLDSEELSAKLTSQAAVKDDPRLQFATPAYLEFLELGGRLSSEDLTAGLLRKHLTRRKPIITGLSATYLYRTPREVGATGDFDDVQGEPAGHFVVLCGYDRRTRRVLLADPLDPNPLSESQSYEVSFDRLIGAIFLGALTYDANLLVVEPS